MTENIAVPREIPFNYTSADDRRAVIHLLGEETWGKLEKLRTRRVTGRSARLLLRVFGEILIHRRNPYLYQELLDSTPRKRRLFKNIETDLSTVEAHSQGESLVAEVISETRGLVESFKRELTQVPADRARAMAALAPIVGKANVLFDPFTLVSHATDATDWRLFVPFAVVTPTEERQVAPLLATIEQLGLKAIPRGAGTGLTGGTVPLKAGCVIVNTERLDHILAIEERDFALAGGGAQKAHVMRLEAGVITEHAIEHATEHGFVFATDPTSAWACTIGGNIAENAGGKMAVLWGTCIDNLLAYDIAMPGGRRYKVRRTDHQLRKILRDDPVTWEVRDEEGRVQRTIALTGSDVRRNGLWKDVTNKTLKGLPGVQKEGTDGIITSAEFVLYRPFPSSRTVCIEFFGPDMDEASKVILEFARAFPNRGEEVLQALEHFDDEYVRAINYKVKAPRSEAPKAVLLVDVVGHTAEQTTRGVERIRSIIAEHGTNTFIFEARDKAEGVRFWADRKKLGAIAARTNAFKLNEDIVLPLEALAEFARFCDATNLVEERASQRTFAERVQRFLETTAEEDGGFLPEKIAHARARCDTGMAAIAQGDEKAVRSLAVLEGLRKDLVDLVRGYKVLADGIEVIYAEERRRRIVIATHMHAGDGNVHVNIPVLSSDHAMMHHAEEVVDQVMAEVARLGGVCTGEHGIGITKFKYLEPQILAELEAYRKQVDPRGTMNPGKLQDLRLLDEVYTPSFNLLELEARILQHGNLEELAVKIAKCVRCGKCKPDCCVFHPARGMFYHPRNKNLAIAALIEALLYEAQRERSSSFELLRYLEEVADHCTMCHKCLKPCPVDIDTGEVSALEKKILVGHGYKRHTMATRASLNYLESTSPTFNALFRGGVRMGTAFQRAMVKVVGGSPSSEIPSAYPLQLFRSPIPSPDPTTLWDILPTCGPGQAIVFEPEGEANGTVFYFPGCGSERLHSSVAKAALHVLTERGTRVVLPPPFLCCGFPSYFNAKTEMHGRIVLRDTIIFSQIREMFSYLSFDAVAVTCGTCHEALGAMEAGKIFECDVQDVSRFALDHGLKVTVDGNERPYLYHAPCHDSMGGQALSILRRAAGIEAEPVPHCCSEAGTLSMSRPDITDSMLHRKQAAMTEALHDHHKGAVILTNCPSCLQGLGRSAELGAEPRHIVVELARALSGDRWQEAIRARAAKAQVVSF